MNERHFKAKPPLISTVVASALPRRGRLNPPSILEREVFPRYCLWIWMLPLVMNPSITVGGFGPVTLMKNGPCPHQVSIITGVYRVLVA